MDQVGKGHAVSVRKILPKDGSPRLHLAGNELETNGPSRSWTLAMITEMIDANSGQQADRLSSTLFLVSSPTRRSSTVHPHPSERTRPKNCPSIGKDPISIALTQIPIRCRLTGPRGPQLDDEVRSINPTKAHNSLSSFGLIKAFRGSFEYRRIAKTRDAPEEPLPIRDPRPDSRNVPHQRTSVDPRRQRPSRPFDYPLHAFRE